MREFTYGDSDSIYPGLLDFDSSTRNNVSLCLCERRHKSIDIECSHVSTSVHTYGLVFNTNVMCRHFICLEELITKYC